MRKLGTLPAKRLRRVYYGHYEDHLLPYPVIRLGGRYLALLDFDIGDTVEVTMEIGKITISKIERPLPMVAEPKPCLK